MRTKKDEEKPKTLGDILGVVEITPLKDFPQGIHQNEIHIDNIKEGVSVPIPRKYLKNMVTEGVIREIPKIK